MTNNLPSTPPTINPDAGKLIEDRSTNLQLVCINNLTGHQITSMEDSSKTQDPEITTVDVHAAKQLIGSGHRYLDVRTVEEFERGHLDVVNPLNIPYMFNTPQGRVKNPDFLEQVMSVCNKEDPLVVGCQSGVRSAYATTDLLKAEFKQVSNMGGGYLAWVDNGFSIRKSLHKEEPPSEATRS